MVEKQHKPCGNIIGMTWCVVIKTGANLHQTLATVRFDRWGTPTKQAVVICNTWAQGLAQAQDQGHRQALFVDSGTVFTDWNQFADLINAYPHKGLIAHIIAKPNSPLYLDDQCWFVDLDKFTVTDLTVTEVTYPEAMISSQNLHDDYTPLWARPGSQSTSHAVTNFGQGLIAKQLQRHLPIVNWNNACREIKHYMYNNTLPLDLFNDYNNLATSQLWLFNNEPVVLAKKKCLVTPGSGLSWMLNIIDSATTDMHIVDISQNQIKFCQHLWQNWNGQDYGTTAWNFIQQHGVIHCQFDNANLSNIDKLKLKSKNRFVAYTNSVFSQLIPENFCQQWQQAQQTKHVCFYNSSLLDWVINNTTVKFDHVWESNIFDYKWTLLHSTPQQWELYKARIK